MGRRELVLVCLLGFLLPAVSGWAQTLGTEGAYLAPRTVFVGDPGRLTAPLGREFLNLSSALIQGPDPLELGNDIRITGIELEIRGNSPRLLIDFIAYAPGLIKLPPITVGNRVVRDLTIPIASILDLEGGPRSLAASASPLAPPGTLTLIYGTLGAILLGFAVLALFLVKGLPFLKTYGRTFRRRRAVGLLKRELKRMRNRLLKKEATGEEILNQISREFRVLLGFLSGLNCMTMVPGEFLSFPPLSLNEKGGEELALHAGPFLQTYFRRCDTLRFSGIPLSSSDVTSLLEDARSFTVELEKSSVPSRAPEMAAKGGAA